MEWTVLFNCLDAYCCALMVNYGVFLFLSNYFRDFEQVEEEEGVYYLQCAILALYILTTVTL